MRPGRRYRENVKQYYRCLNGEYVYVGDVVSSPLPEQEGRAARRRLIFLAAGAAACVLAAGSIPAPGMQQGPAVLPFYLGEVCSALRMLWAAVCLGRENWGSIRGYRFADTAGVLPVAGGFTVFFTAAAAAGCGFCLLSAGGETDAPLPWTVLFFLLQLGAAGLALNVRKTARSLPWEKTAPPTAGGGEDPSGDGA